LLGQVHYQIPPISLDEAFRIDADCTVGILALMLSNR